MEKFLLNTNVYTIEKVILHAIQGSLIQKIKLKLDRHSE